MEKLVVKFTDIMNGTGFTSTMLYHFSRFVWLENQLKTVCTFYILHSVNVRVIDAVAKVLVTAILHCDRTVSIKSGPLLSGVK